MENAKRSPAPPITSAPPARRLHPEECCQRLEAAGADVVGLNWRGPRTMLPLLTRIRDVVSGQMAALPVPYRTTAQEPTFQSLSDPELEVPPFHTRLDPFVCTRDEMGEFGIRAYNLGIRYLGVRCGAGPHHGESRIIRSCYAEGPQYVPLIQAAFPIWRQLEEETGTELLTENGALFLGRLDSGFVKGALATGLPD